MKLEFQLTSEFEEVWPIFQAVIATADTYVFPPDMTASEAASHWLSAGETYLAMSGATVLGTYILKPNQLGLGDHIANAAFMVSPAHRGKGAGRAMAEHALSRARALGYRAMQFNLVVSTNRGAIALWRSLGFAIIGTIPEAFRHRTLGFVDAHIMHRTL